MRRVFLLMLMSIAAFSAMAQTKGKDVVEVMYFHGKQRCATCMAIEKYVREVVDADFAKEKKAGKVVFREIDISTPAGEKIARDYRVTWSSLFVNGWKEGKETRNDMTKFAFKNARSDTEKFKRGVSDAIRKNMVF